MLGRQKILLGLLLRAPKMPTRLELIKWVFLLKQESSLSSDSSFYDFIPYKYGPFSFILYRDIAELRRYGYIDGKDYMIAPELRNDAGQLFASIPRQYQDAVATILSDFGSCTRDELIDHVYDTYPWYAVRSEIRRVAMQNEQPAERATFTIGYEGISLDRFLQQLLKKGISTLIDVRYNPISRKYGFSGKRLERLCRKLDIDYVHLPELGIPPTLRSSLNTYDDYQRLLNMYEHSILPNAAVALKQAMQIVQHERAALLCFEADVSCCHRGRVANSIAEVTGFDVVHL